MIPIVLAIILVTTLSIAAVVDYRRLTDKQKKRPLHLIMEALLPLGIVFYIIGGSILGFDRSRDIGLWMFVIGCGYFLVTNRNGLRKKRTFMWAGLFVVWLVVYLV
ncbi:hypothetical protein LCM20_08910 [Halobacillus litoralis]|uniref:hypothetical protein n=1 Tax=Halobacillus litoralis TaxID=45668 RepID=UPI001CD5F2A2|nr:hypothetical protein [Halobacillus litoralis]MCA0970706.1 hypothetical protein [Halobacillus litoralis]